MKTRIILSTILTSLVLITMFIAIASVYGLYFAILSYVVSAGVLGAIVLGLFAIFEKDS